MSRQSSYTSYLAKLGRMGAYMEPKSTLQNPQNTTICVGKASRIEKEACLSAAFAIEARLSEGTFGTTKIGWR